MRSGARSVSGLIVLGVGYTWFYNGANFVAFKVGGESFHPLVLAALRFGLAALLLLPVAGWRWRIRRATPRELAGAALLGPVMLIGSQTMAIWGTHLLPAGVASVFGSSAPVFLTVFAWLFLGQAPGGRQIAGVTLGLIGLAAMAWFSSSATGFSAVGAAMTLTAAAVWAAGSLWAARLRLPADAVVGLAAQLVPTALLLALAVGVTGLWTSLDVSRVPPRAWGALAFLIVASTLVGYAVFLAVNRASSSILANSFNYAAPVIALALSTRLLNEPVGWTKMIAAGITLAGVALMVSAGRVTTTPPAGPEQRHAGVADDTVQPPMVKAARDAGIGG